MANNDDHRPKYILHPTVGTPNGRSEPSALGIYTLLNFKAVDPVAANLWNSRIEWNTFANVYLLCQPGNTLFSCITMNMFDLRTIAQAIRQNKLGFDTALFSLRTWCSMYRFIFLFPNSVIVIMWLPFTVNPLVFASSCNSPISTFSFLQSGTRWNGLTYSPFPL